MKYSYYGKIGRLEIALSDVDDEGYFTAIVLQQFYSKVQSITVTKLRGFTDTVSNNFDNLSIFPIDVPLLKKNIIMALFGTKKL